MEIRTIEVAGLYPAMEAIHLPFSKDALSTRQWHNHSQVPYADAFLIHNNCFDAIANKDVDLAEKLARAGDPHAKVLRGVVAYIEVNAPIYWWNEMVTYRIGIECLSSTSTMHTITKRPLTVEDFESPDLDTQRVVDIINDLINEYNQYKNEDVFLRIKRLLPQNFKQKRICMASYQTLRRIHSQRRGHRLPEWKKFCEWIATLPLADKLIIDGKHSV